MAEKKKYSYVTKTFSWNDKRYYVRGKTEREVNEKLADLIHSLKGDEDVINKDMSVNAWYREWKETYKEPSGITKKSLGMYDEKYKHYIGPIIGRMKLKDVRDIQLQKILNRQAGMSYSHVSKIRLVMKEMFKQARISRLIIYDPAENLTLPKVVKRSHRSLTEEEQEEVLRLAENHKAGLWVKMILYSGLRPSETIPLQWKDIDFEKNEIHVYKSVESGKDGVIKRPKTDSGVRDIPIAEPLREALLKQKGKPNELVFKTELGNMHSNDSINRLWASFKRDLDIQMGADVYRNKIVGSRVSDGIVPYCLRHTFCTNLQRAGIPMNIAKELMGHSDISVTANIYTHRENAVLHEQIAKLNALDCCKKCDKS